MEDDDFKPSESSASGSTPSKREHPHREHKAMNWGREQKKRQAETLARQKEEKKKKLERARSLVTELCEPEEHSAMAEEGAESASSPEKRHRRRRTPNEEIMQGEWMLDVPDDLSKNWFVIVRPEGQRCLVISARGKTMATSKTGNSIFKSFKSGLPNGGNNNAQNSQNYCVLDCVFSTHDNTFYVIDMVCWCGLDMYEWTAEFRHFWLAGKLSEVQISEVTTFNQFRIRAAPRFECTRESLTAAYTKDPGFVRDGLMFVNKETAYTPGQTPLVLLWKDSATCRYFDANVEEDRKNGFALTLEVRSDKSLQTLDGIPLGSITDDFIAANQIQEKDLLKFTARGVDGSTLVGLEFKSKAAHRRGSADPWAKIVFSYCSIAHPLTFDRIMEKATSAFGLMEMSGQLPTEGAAQGSASAAETSDHSEMVE